MAYWAHSNPEAPGQESPSATDQTASARPCPGVCNRDWRKADRDHRRAEQAEKDLAKIERRSRRPISCKDCRDEKLPHGLPAVPGSPVWCGPCVKRVRRALLSLPDLYVQLELDKLHGSRAAGEHVSGSKAAPSPAPSADEQDELLQLLTGWEDEVRARFGFSHRPARLSAGGPRLPMATAAPDRSSWPRVRDVFVVEGQFVPDRCPWPRPRPKRGRPWVGDRLMARSVEVLRPSQESVTVVEAVRFLVAHLEQSLRVEDRRVPLAIVLQQFEPGSFDGIDGRPWTWDDEEADILSRVCLHCGEAGGYQLHLEEHLALVGRVERGICLGDDERVWDGHHRVIAARRLGFPDLPLEAESFVPLGARTVAERLGKDLLRSSSRLRLRTRLGEQRARKPVPCPRCGLKTLVHEGGEDYVSCENPDCGRLLKMDEYDQLAMVSVRMARHERSVGA